MEKKSKDVFTLALTLILTLFLSDAKGQSTTQPSKTRPNLTSSSIPYPFFLKGDGKIHIKNTHNGREIEIDLIDKQGRLIDDAFYKVDHVFGYPTSSKGEHISQRMLFMLDHFSDHFAKGQTIFLKSGYRSPKYNQNLIKKGRTAAKTSTHMDGMAIDFYLKGVDGKTMWEHIRHKDCCGVGHYGGPTVHLDAGRPRFWEQATSKVKTKASAFNRYIYLSTDYDKYQKEGRIRLFFTSISDFGFGIRPKVEFVEDIEGAKTKAHGQIESSHKKCHPINLRKDARFIYAKLPKKLKPGRYRVRVNFCDKPFKEMPDFKVSNEIEIVDL